MKYIIESRKFKRKVGFKFSIGDYVRINRGPMKNHYIHKITSRGDTHCWLEPIDLKKGYMGFFLDKELKLVPEHEIDAIKYNL